MYFYLFIIKYINLLYTMPNFKPKPNKKLFKKVKPIITLDSKHNEKMNLFNKQINILLPNLLKERKMIIKSIKTEKNISKILDFEDKLREINIQVNKIKKEKKEYLLTNSKYIFEYFEKKKTYQKGIIKQKFYMIFLKKIKLKLLKNKNHKQLLIIIYQI